ncbi:MAG: hypothetical protein M5U01_35025 [Ardenticatenaceae bacterium]|nr:hypothetical protein [Ardenticatenaceae bacterium]
MYEFLLSILEDLEREQIRYCLLRDFHDLDRLAADGDVDLLVQHSHFAPLCGLLTQRGFVHLPTLGHEPHHFFVAYDEKSDRWLKFDVVTEVTYGRPIRALRTALAEGCLRNRRRCGPIFGLTPEDELVTLLLHCVLDKANVAAARRRRLEVLRHEVTNEHYLTTLLATYWSPTMTWPELAAQIDAGHWMALLTEGPAVAARLASRNPLGTLGRRIRGRVLRRLSHWTAILRPAAPMVALLAPDGAGKSTLAAGIQKSFYLPVRPVYMGLYQNGSARSAYRRLPGLGLAGRLVTQWRRYLTARYHQARGRLVIFDRYTYDALLTPHEDLNWLKRGRRRLLAHACPAPDLIVMLDVQGKVLHTRKGEHSATRLEQQRQRYLELQVHLPRMIVVDATRDAEHVRRHVTALIWHGYGNRLMSNERERTRQS